MKRAPLTNRMYFNNILYIGDEAKECIAVIEKFSERLLEIERHYANWFSGRHDKLQLPDKLQRHIQYHFEGGIAIFRFRNEDELPLIIRNECLIACRNLAAVELSYAS